MGMIQEELSSSGASSPLQYFSLMSLSPGIGPPYPWLREMKSEERGLCLIHLLLACTKHVASGSIEDANTALECISHLASPIGDTMQRIAAYFTESLADRTLKALPGLHKALNSTKIPSFTEEFVVQKLFFELCPFLKLSYLVTNQSIMEAMEGEKMVHIIDLHCCEPAQWVSLLQAFGSRPGGPPHLRITGVNQRKEVLDQMAIQLNKEAENLDIPFQFNPVVSLLENLDVEKLRVKTGEALAITSVSKLHTLLSLEDNNNNNNHNRAFGESQDIINRDKRRGLSPESASSSSLPSSKLSTFLSALWGLSPKVMVVTEQEANHNGSSLLERVMEALNFYAALFDCLESTLPRASVERQKVEKMLFGEQIKNIVACEGFERKERHEKLEKWVQRLEITGFGRVPLTYQSFLLAKRFLQSNSSFDGYRIVEEGGCLFICWQDRPLYSVSSWRFRRMQNKHIVFRCGIARRHIILPRASLKTPEPPMIGISLCSSLTRYLPMILIELPL
ncbi:hypothetical protein V2J09_012094 [Rumex salicifolius]